MNAHDACFPGKEGHDDSQSPLFLYNGNINRNRNRRAASMIIAGQAPIHDECAESLGDSFLGLKRMTWSRWGAHCGGRKSHAQQRQRLLRLQHCNVGLHLDHADECSRGILHPGTHIIIKLG